MQIEYLFGSKTKTEILKYLIFREEGLSARELESKLHQSFPAIKKQIDNLELAGIINKNKKGNRWHIKIVDHFKPLIYKIFLFDIISFLNKLLDEYYYLDKFLLGDLFFPDLNDKVGVDLIFVYNGITDLFFLEELKKKIGDFFEAYFIDIKVSFFEKNNYDKRLKYADKFVLKVTKLNQNLYFK